MDELLGLLLVLEHQSVEVTGTPDLELGGSGVLLDDGRLDVLSAGQLDKLLDVLDFLGHFC